MLFCRLLEQEYNVSISTWFRELYRNAGSGIDKGLTFCWTRCARMYDCEAYAMSKEDGSLLHVLNRVLSLWSTAISREISVVIVVREMMKCGAGLVAVQNSLGETDRNHSPATAFTVVSLDGLIRANGSLVEKGHV